MRGSPVCPRCGSEVYAPDIWSSDWTCTVHGGVHPVQPLVQPSSAYLHDVAHRSRVPVWLPWPLPTGWVVTGVVHAGDERSGERAVGITCSGPAPLGGMGELLVVAEEPGVGLGARFAGLSAFDPGEGIAQGPPSAKVVVEGHLTGLWALDAAAGVPPDRAAYVGEADGMWLWAVLWPSDAGYLVADDVRLIDLRDDTAAFDVPCGALSPRLTT